MRDASTKAEAGRERSSVGTSQVSRLSQSSPKGGLRAAYFQVLACDECQGIFRWQRARGFHLIPFRTEKLSPLAPLVLQCNAGE